MTTTVYTVAATFTNDRVAQAWLQWLRDGHINAVLAGGAVAAEVVKVDGADCRFEIRYRFPSRSAFAAYESDHAPRLRAEGLKRFPTSHGINYHRTIGEVVEAWPSNNSNGR